MRMRNSRCVCEREIVGEREGGGGDRDTNVVGEEERKKGGREREREKGDGK